MLSLESLPSVFDAAEPTIGMRVSSGHVLVQFFKMSPLELARPLLCTQAMTLTISISISITRTITLPLSFALR